ncbi:MAG: hypothetical protein PHU30_07610, partial [Oscillospiraceae bacterium]|nr:hypothetical protein [Oscillospiraceae bacterium]
PAAQAAKEICRLGAEGCVVLSTCNRIEIWISGSVDPLEAFCRVRQLDFRRYEPFAVRRGGIAAVEYLHRLAAGLESQIFGEDQIITQVGDALAAARQVGATDSVLEELFRFAVTGAKKVKTQLHLTLASASVATAALELIQKQVHKPLNQCRCLIIGNGEMGRLAAKEMLAAGMQVRMTLRNYLHSGPKLVSGCQAVPYEQRLEVLPWADVVISATISPHHTIKTEEARPFLHHPILLLDLAVPRDLEPSLAEISGVQLFNMDDLSAVIPTKVQGREAALKILEEFEQELIRRYEFRPYLPRLEALSTQINPEKIRQFTAVAEKFSGYSHPWIQAAGGSIRGLLYGVREHLPPSQWEPCISALERTVEKEKRL